MVEGLGFRVSGGFSRGFLRIAVFLSGVLRDLWDFWRSCVFIKEFLRDLLVLGDGFDDFELDRSLTLWQKTHLSIELAESQKASRCFSGYLIQTFAKQPSKPR